MNSLCFYVLAFIILFYKFEWFTVKKKKRRNLNGLGKLKVFAFSMFLDYLQCCLCYCGSWVHVFVSFVDYADI